MLNGSKNEVNGLLARLFATESSEIPRSFVEADKKPERLAPELRGAERSPDVLKAIGNAKANIGKSDFSTAFSELMNTKGLDKQTPNATVEKIVTYYLKSANLTDKTEEAIQDVNIKVMTKLDNYDPLKATFNGWLAGVTKNHVVDVVRAAGAHVAIGGLGGGAGAGAGAGDDAGGMDVARDRRQRNEPTVDPKKAAYEFTSDDTKYCDFLKDYLTKVLDGSVAFPHGVHVRKSNDPEDAELDNLPPDQREKRRTLLNVGKVFAFMTHHGLGAPKLKFADLSNVLDKTYGIRNFYPERGQQWYIRLWNVLEKEFFMAAKGLGVDVAQPTGRGEEDADRLIKFMADFRKKLTKKIQSQAVGKPFCEDELSNGLYDLLSVLESWHASANG